MRRAMLKRVEQAVEAGDLPTNIDPQTSPTPFASTHIALSVEARAGTCRAELEEKVRRFLDFILRAA